MKEQGTMKITASKNIFLSFILLGFVFVAFALTSPGGQFSLSQKIGDVSFLVLSGIVISFIGIAGFLTVYHQGGGSQAIAINPVIVKYVKKQLKKGETPSHIEQSLRLSGCTDKEIYGALRFATKDLPKQQSTKKTRGSQTKKRKSPSKKKT